jgi:hypothetical protein
MRRIGLLMGRTDADPEARSWLAAFVQGLRELGWSDGIDLPIDERWIKMLMPPEHRLWRKS